MSVYFLNLPLLMKEDNFFNSSYSTDMDGNFETRLIQGLKNRKITFTIIFQKKGAYFIKHHKYGAPKLRHISLDKELAKIYWREPNQFNQNSGFKGFIEVKVF